MNNKHEENKSIANVLGYTLNEYSKANDDKIASMRDSVKKLSQTKENLENSLSELSNTDADIMDTIKLNNDYK